MMKYLSFFTITARNSLANKTSIIGTLILLMVILFIYNQLWIVIGKDNAEPGLNTSFIWYLLMGEIIILSTSRVERQIEDDIRTGTMAYYLNKPVSFFAMRFTEAIAAMSVLAFSMLLIGGSFVFLITPSVPFSWQHLPFIILCLYFSCIANILLFIALGYAALWLNEVRTVTMAVQRLAFIFGGAIFPLSIYPEWFIDIAKLTPFYSLYYLTIRLVYDFSWQNLYSAVSLNLFWTGLISSFLFLAYKKLQTKVNVYGG